MPTACLYILLPNSSDTTTNEWLPCDRDRTLRVEESPLSKIKRFQNNTRRDGTISMRNLRRICLIYCRGAKQVPLFLHTDTLSRHRVQVALWKRVPKKEQHGANCCRSTIGFYSSCDGAFSNPIHGLTFPMSAQLP